ncbi:MAG: serine/threonine protein kinase [Pseudonocardiaceae bacterium]|nr:serine/threonine protein kinase [Pseudonocardiaceae bacterium]
MRSDDVIADRYRLVELIGSGGMGIVWLAVDLREQREVALKRPHALGGSIRADLEREADVARRVAHPNAIEVFDVVGDGDDCWLVMEYFPATSLAAKGVLPAREVAAVGAQVAAALAAAHAADVVHRDVTPGNVLVSDDGTAKVTDFGISAWRAATITSSGKISGTAAYVSPEVADGNGAKAPSDVFSLGATLFAAVEGTPPFGTGDPDVILARIRAGRGTPARHAGALEPVLNALMRRERGDRPTAAQAKEMLDRVADGQTVPVWSAPAKRKRPALLVAGAALAVVAVLVLAFLRPWETEPNGPTGPARTALGDPRTADPCSVADPAVLQRFGDAGQDADYGGLNRCDVLITVPGDDRVDVMFQFDGPAGTTPPAQVVRHEPKQVGADCGITFTLTDGNVLEVVARTSDEVDTDLCAVADTAADHAESVLRGHAEIPRRPARDAGSLAHLDACALLQQPDLCQLAETFAAPVALHLPKR